MSKLVTNYMDSHFRGKRKFELIDNGDNTISFDDKTDYIVSLKNNLIAQELEETHYLVTDASQQLIGIEIPVSASIINATTTEINRLINEFSYLLP